MRLNRFAMTLGTAAALAAIAACGGDDNGPSGPDPNKRVEVFEAIMSGANETTQPNTSTAGGSGTLRIYSTRADASSPFVADSMRYDLSWNGLTNNSSGAHIHAPAAHGANASVVHNFAAPAVTTGSVSGVFTVPSNTITATSGLNLQQLAEAIRAGNAYFNVHSTPSYGGGEIRGQLVPAT